MSLDPEVEKRLNALRRPVALDRPAPTDYHLVTFKEALPYLFILFLGLLVVGGGVVWVFWLAQ